MEMAAQNVGPCVDTAPGPCCNHMRQLQSMPCVLAWRNVVDAVSDRGHHNALPGNAAAAAAAPSLTSLGRKLSHAVEHTLPADDGTGRERSWPGMDPDYHTTADPGLAVWYAAMPRPARRTCRKAASGHSVEECGRHVVDAVRGIQTAIGMEHYVR